MIDDTEAAVHLLAIRKALSNGNAAVMVGSGFSFNAEGGSQLASWDALATAILDDLDPKREKSDTKVPPAEIIQLGEQYARVLTKSGLDELLKRMIPDEKVNPGTLHEQLLQLSWAEIFTTNYDTLLERAAEKIPERAHYTVMCREDIPQSKMLGRRRIVKLHGSFPAQRPFIFTEEDYRTYPTNFAPFVNLVRQALLENIFCLVGFSGDDPNFLHWIGWVRDMLDEHALPIYLFLPKAPTLGYRKLLEARRVTPIVLPLPDQCDPKDYATRYTALFQNLAEPLKPSDSKWGQDFQIFHEPWSYTNNDDEQFARFMEFFPQLRQLRNAYPGWLVAPVTARKNLDRVLRTLPFYLEIDRIARSNSTRYPLLSITLLAHYTWQQDVLLQCFDDKLAHHAIDLIKAQKPPFDASSFAIEAALLKEAGIVSIRQVQVQWRDLVLGLLRWSREELHESIFDELKSILPQAFPGDGWIADEVKHQSILQALYLGDRDIARRLLLDWSVHSSNIYFDVRKAALLTEVGEMDAGLTLGIEALERIRRRRKLYPESARYLSEEAWACLIIRNMLRAKDPFERRRDAKSINQEGGPSQEKMKRRLADLARQDYDVIFEISEIQSELNAEAQPPSKPRNRMTAFDLGRYPAATRIGMSGDLREKIAAAFAWLSLADRVALVPRMGSISFELTSYTQAAWWTQYVDSPQRVLSVAIRTLSTDVLKPADDSEPAHHTGWLSRFQVAETDETLAFQVCERSLRVIERTLSSGDDALQILRFHLEIFSRLVIRIRNVSAVLAFAERIIVLHKSPHIAQWPSVWELLGKSIARCWDALPSSMQDKLVLQIVTITGMPLPQQVHQHYTKDWLQLSPLWRYQTTAPTVDRSSPELTDLITALISKIENAADRDTSTPTGFHDDTRAWEVLFWLDHLGLVLPATRQAIGNILWANSTTWPCIPNYPAEATRAWPSPEGINKEKVFREWILEQSLARFDGPGAMQITDSSTSKHWGFPVNNRLLTAWKASLSGSPWPIQDMVRGLNILKQWWEDEWASIVTDIPRIHELAEAVIDRMDDFDVILATGLPAGWETSSLIELSIKGWIKEVVNASKPFAAHFWRLRLHLALEANDGAEFGRIQQELSDCFLDASMPDSTFIAAHVIEDWLTVDHYPKVQCPDLLLGVLCGIVATRRMPSLIWALHLLVKIARNQAQWVTERMFQMIELGLDALVTELSYQGRSPGSDIPDTDVPILRFNCARLALAFIDGDAKHSASVLSKWADQTQNDPLPEMRFIEERQRA
ncbi:SIR2 family NAD-dependent protein deacylase [Dyella tabacisoli]|uniref:SIR2 family protein n=1 Tax=Dyella tabacisoli TaxID=2282381 RepID=A0A369UJ13_9GAMM|nr:SIR2 family protein [Dyella tabacisoli]RDD80105.1 SIR2 family protein [Dyella tabacisoli]